MCNKLSPTKGDTTMSKTKNFVIEAFNSVIEKPTVLSNSVEETMARTVSHNCFKFGYRVVPFTKKDEPMKYLIESSDMTIEHVQKKLKTLNPDRKRPAKSVNIPLVDLRSGKVNMVLEFTIEKCLRCNAYEIITDLSGLAACC